MKKTLIPISLALLLLLTGCGKELETKTIYIAEQFGTAYAPVALMREAGILEEVLPEGTEIRWSQLGNTAAIREAMLAGEADIGFMAIPPFIIGRAAGMQWHICSGISDVPMGLVSSNPEIASLPDIGSARIALPQPGSIQHILLAMAAEKQLGQYDIFDNQLVTMAHPDGMTALLSGSEIALHFTTSPYLGQELSEGLTLVLTGEEAMGEPFTGIVAVALDAFMEEYPELYEIFLAALHEAIDRLQVDPAAAAKILAPVYGMTEEALLRELTGEGAAFLREVRGTQAFADFLFKAGYVKTAYLASSLLASEALVK